MRLLATTQACMDADDPPVDSREILQKSFYFLADLANRINDHRKGKSIPDSIFKENVLFSKEDVATAKAARALNKVGRANPLGGPSSRNNNDTNKSKWNNFRSNCGGWGRGRGYNSWKPNNSWKNNNPRAITTTSSKGNYCPSEESAS